MNIRLASVKSIINRVYRRLNLNEDLPEDDMIEWVGEALLRIGAFSQFITKVITVDVVNGKVELPCDFYKLVEITYGLNSDKPTAYLPWRWESFMNEYFCEDCQIPIWKNPQEEYFMIQNAYIYTSFSTGKLCISYLAMPTDNDGYPMVPDEEYVMDACSKYVILQLDYREWRKGAITDKIFNHSEREWHWAIGAARGAMNMPNTQQLDTIRNVIQRLIPNHRFRNQQEKRKIQ